MNTNDVERAAAGAHALNMLMNPQSTHLVIDSATTSPSVYSPATSSFRHSPSFKTEENDVCEGSLNDTTTTTTTTTDPLPSKKKQKRNKPTLSCEECVERKTKCDRGRPNCLACIKRQTTCVYATQANILDETDRAMASGRRMTKPPKRKPVSGYGSSSDNTTKIATPIQRDMSIPRNSTSSSGLRLLNIPQDPYSQNPYGPAPSAHPNNVFGIGSEHPFANFWTRHGGLPEVISVLPSKDQANMLLEMYFECVDPVYPMLHRQTFYADYEHFWPSPSGPPRENADGALVALIFVMMAMGTQFVTSTSSADRQKSAEFYVSASHQALRMSSYLNHSSLRSIQTMVLITYFLINDNHAGDGWSFAGVLIRQSYAMGLHRDPNIVVPTASIFEKQMRRKLWQAVLLQDTFLTVLLSLPPSATHTDVNVEDLIDDTESIGAESPADTAYIRGCWTLANLVQESICSPRSLDLPICSTPRQKSTLLSHFRQVYRSFPDVFRSWDAASLTASINPESYARTPHTNTNPTNITSPTIANHIPLPPAIIDIPSSSAIPILNLSVKRRIVRQTLFLTSNYFHNVMLLHASECKEGGVPVNIRGALDAAHEAIQSFFLLNELFRDEAKVWWVFNHRAFLETVCISNIMRDKALEEVKGGGGDGGKGEVETSTEWLRDPLFARAKADVEKMLQTMQLASRGEPGHSSEVAKTRVEILSGCLRQIPNVNWQG